MTKKEIQNLVVLCIIALLFGLAVGKCIAQEPFREKPYNALYLSFQPADLGFGIRGDVHFNYWLGAYGSASYGQWRLYKDSGLDQHVKITLGPLIPFTDWMGNQHDFTIGLNYHHTSGEITDFINFKEDGIFHQPWSFELGLTIKYQKFALGFRTDILRWEPCFEIGIPIK
jgi:hypothetical protein